MPADSADAAALAIRDTACAELVTALQAESAERGGPAPETVAEHATKLFTQYFGVSQQRGEPPEQAAGKISRLVARQTRKALGFEPPPAPPPEPEPPAGTVTGAVTGRTAGIERKLMNVLAAVAAHYGTDIAIVSGVRSRQSQGGDLFTNWHSHLRDGRDNAWLAKNEKLRLQLDTLKQEKNRAGFLDLLKARADWSALSRHIDGNEVDLALATPPEIVSALATVLNHRTGRNTEGARVHHFDNSRILWPIPESTRARWNSGT